MAGRCYYLGVLKLAWMDGELGFYYKIIHHQSNTLKKKTFFYQVNMPQRVS